MIVYDRRGEGRSKTLNAKFTLKETFDNLDTIYEKLRLREATLIGHSFGGVVGNFLLQNNPERVQSIILVGAPVSLQETLLEQ